MIRRLLIWAITIVVALWLIRQARKPNWWIGRPFLWAMNFSHSALTDWGLQQVSIEPDFKILDVGCGGGRTIQKLATVATEGFVHGVDYLLVARGETRGTAVLINNGNALTAVWENAGGKIMTATLELNAEPPKNVTALAEGGVPAAINTPGTLVAAYAANGQSIWIVPVPSTYFLAHK